jgi:ATP-dependent DNA ligase
LNEMMQAINTRGGEGVILRKVGSLYEHGKTATLLKFKVSTFPYHSLAHSQHRHHPEIKKAKSLVQQAMDMFQ